MDYKYFGLLAFLILVLGLGFILWRWPQGKHLTFSQHVAVARYKRIYYIVLFAIALPLLLIFFGQWFVPTFGLSMWFTIFVSLAALAQCICTLIPELEGWRKKSHQLLAGISALSLLPPLGYIVVTTHIPIVGRVISVVSLLGMVGVIGILLLRKGSRYHLVLQVVYYVAFFLPILVISYL